MSRTRTLESEMKSSSHRFWLFLVSGDRPSAMKASSMERVETSYERIEDGNENAFFLTLDSDLIRIPNVRSPKDYSALPLHLKTEHFLGSREFDYVLGVCNSCNHRYEARRMLLVCLFSWGARPRAKLPLHSGNMF